MIKYLKKVGFKETKNKDDMTDKEFYLQNVFYENDTELTTFNNIKVQRVETYILFYKSFDPSIFNTKLEDILNSALDDGIGVYQGVTVESERVENGYNITMNFTIKG